MKSARSSLLIGVVLTLVLMGAVHLILKSGVAPQVGEVPAPASEDEAPPQSDEVVYIDQVVQALSAWDADRLKPLLAPETLAGSSDAQLDQVLGTLGERLGALRSYEPPALEQRVPIPGEPENLSSYRLVAYYDKGTADVSLVLQQDAGTHHLYSFNVDVPQPQQL